MPETMTAREASSMHAPLTILFAEDDDALREVTALCLRSMNFTVLACRDAVTAKSSFLAQPHVDLLLTDLEMPGRSGVELARDLTSLRPMLPVLIVTESLLSEEMVEEIGQRRWGYMSKPCLLPSLVSTIQLLTTEADKLSVLDVAC